MKKSERNKIVYLMVKVNGKQSTATKIAKETYEVAWKLEAAEE